jgi:hypothetical protein
VYKAFIDACYASPIPASKKYLLVYLAKFAGEEGEGIYPGIAMIMRDLSWSKPTTIENLKWLIVEQWIVPDGKQGRNNNHRLNLEKLNVIKGDKNKKLRPVLKSVKRITLEAIPPSEDEIIGGLKQMAWRYLKAYDENHMSDEIRLQAEAAFQRLHQDFGIEPRAIEEEYDRVFNVRLLHGGGWTRQ